MTRLALLLMPLLGLAAQPGEDFRPIPLKSSATGPAPMTGIVFWTTSEHNASDAIQLEFSYMNYRDVVKEKDKYDWSAVDRLLEKVAKRKHQAILRFYFVYPGKKTTVPDYIKALPDYKETNGKSEKKATSFCDWSHPELKRFTLDFYSKFAERYDRDPRLAFVETGFGLWAEYHIYDGPMQLGKTFPDKAFQAEFARHLSKCFKETPWLMSVDAGDTWAPFASDKELLRGCTFGQFDDSLLCKEHKQVNEKMWNHMGRERWKQFPAGGETSYYNDNDQRNALARNGPNGVSFEQAARDFHLTFVIANDQPRYQKFERIREAGQACGYRFRILAFEANDKRSRVTVTNTGVAPIYQNAFVAVNGVRSGKSLKGLLPGEKLAVEVEAGGAAPTLTIVSDRLVPDQHIEFEADLPR